MKTTDTYTAKSYCRICQGFCGVEVLVKNGRIEEMRGDRDNPLTRGYICIKGLQNPELHHGPGRLTQPLKRNPSGDYKPVSSALALEEIAEQLTAITKQYGNDSVAVFIGTQAYFSAVNPVMAASWAGSFPTPCLFCTMTIDQSAKWITEARLGRFAGGWQSFLDADVWLLAGTNPLISIVGGPGMSGFPHNNPVKNLRDAKARGLKLIIIDPRETETARHADLFLQPLPGRDAEIFASLIHIILAEGWHDRMFCDRYVNGLDALRDAVASFSPEAVAPLAKVTEDELVAVARLFAHESGSGMAGSGTGPNMGPHSNLAEHLIQTLNVICGRFLREGETIANPGVLSPAAPAHAEVSPPFREWETGYKSRVHGLGLIKGHMMSATLTDEILDAGEDRIRALICIGANPAVALPDQARAEKALKTLDLLVTVDTRMSATARMADYVIAPLLPFERPDHTGFFDRWFHLPYAQYTEAIIEPESGFDLVDSWYVFWELAHRMGIQLEFAGHQLDMTEPPTAETLLEMLAEGSRVHLSNVKARHTEGGQLYPPAEPITVLPQRTENKARFELTPDDVLEEIKSLKRGNVFEAREGLPYLLVVRRMKEVMNSFCSDLPEITRRVPGNPAGLHPSDMETLQLKNGQVIRISSESGAVTAVARSDASLKPGLISVSHCWGGLLEEDLLDQVSNATGKAPTNRLVHAKRGVQSINHMPIMTGIPVRIEVI